MSIMDEFFTGVNPTKEVLNLWVEQTYLRFVVSGIIAHLMEKELSLTEYINTDMLDKFRKQAIEEVSKKFPNISLEYKSSASEANQEEAPQCNPPTP